MSCIGPAELHAGKSESDYLGDFVDWKVGVSKQFFGLDFELAYTDTDIDDVAVSDGRVYLGIIKNW